jgi:FkbM family methyltransferase
MPPAVPSQTNDLSPFGAHAPNARMAALLRLTRRAGASWLHKRIAFLLRGWGVRALHGQPLDVQSLGVWMRLYPQHNVCEKRILFTPQYFDAPERAYLTSRLRDDFVFLDIGANIGGYALSVAAQAGPGARILAIEPQPEVYERLVYNIRQNPFATVKALDCAVADRDGEITLFVHHANRGESSIRIVSSDAAAGARVTVPAKSLARIVQEEGYARIDAVKLDVEGAEDVILEPYFRDMPEALWPKTILIEEAPQRWSVDLIGLLKARGYRDVLRTRQNLVLERT